LTAALEPLDSLQATPVQLSFRLAGIRVGDFVNSTELNSNVIETPTRILKFANQSGINIAEH
jgi:hypothetical protein